MTKEHSKPQISHSKENNDGKWNTCWRVKCDARQACFRQSYQNYTKAYVKVLSYNLLLMSLQPQTCGFTGVAKRGASWRRESLIGPGLDYPAVALLFLAYQGEN